MSTGLLILCLAAAEAQADEVPHYDAGYQAFQAGDYRRVVLECTAFLEGDQELTQQPGLRASFYDLRGCARHELGEFRQAVQDFTAAIELDADDAHFYLDRAAAYEALGETARAKADRERADELLSKLFEAENFGSAQSFPWNVLAVLSVVSWQSIPVLWVVLTAVYAFLGNRRRIQARGSLWPLWSGSLALAGLASLPWIIYALVVEISGGTTRLLWTAGTATILSAIWAGMAVGRRIQLSGLDGELPLIENEEFLRRVRELAGRLRIAFPDVRLLRSADGSLPVQAYAAGLFFPSLVVTDGVLHRLEPHERDSILAHEMAHIANRSLWLHTAVGALSASAAVAAGATTPSVDIPLGLAVFVGLYPALNRLLEFDCDRRAAEAVGYRATAAALTKLHARSLYPIRTSGWLPLLVYATGTHPPLDRRLEALHGRAPSDDKPDSGFSETAVRQHRLAALAAFVLWLAILAGTLFAVPHLPNPFWGALPLLAVSITPSALMKLETGWLARRARRREGIRIGREQLRPVLMYGSLGILLIWYVLDLGLMPMNVNLSLIGLFWIALLWPDTSGRVHKQVKQAVQNGDYQRALELGEAHPRAVSRNHRLRHNLALAADLNGDRERAITELERLRREKPRFTLSSFALAALYLETDRLEEALEIAEEQAEKLGNDPGPHFIAFRALRRLGRLDEAQAALDRAQALEPDAGEIEAARAALALDRGELDRAEEFVERAEQLLPGDVYVRIVEAELAIARGDCSQAREAVERAVATCEANPMARYDADCAALESRLADLEVDAPSA